MDELEIWPKVRDSLTYLYLEQCRIYPAAKAIGIDGARLRLAVSCSALTLLMLGPGTTITHAAVRALTSIL